MARNKIEPKIYQIRRKSDKQYSKGGHHPHWYRTGKYWQNLTDLIRHLTLWGQKYSRCYNDKEHEIVEYTLFITSYDLIKNHPNEINCGVILPTFEYRETNTLRFDEVLKHD